MGVPISNVTRRVVYTASGTGPYAFTFEILANTDIAVYKDDTLLTLTTDYTVTIASNGTGSITLVTAPTGATQIAIVGNRTIQRTTDFVTGGDFFANTVNDEMDQQTIFAQQNAEGLQRALQAPQTDPTSINMTLPRKALRASKYLAFDENGNPTPGATAIDISEILPFTEEIAAVSEIAADVVIVSENITDIQNASENADSALASATAAAASASAAAASYESFDDRYLGAKETEPTLDNDGNALIAGALYFNSVSLIMRVYTGSSWQNTGVPLPLFISTDVFSGNASTTAFTLSSAPAFTNACEVYISGVSQIPVTNYTVSGTTLTFVEAPPTGTDNIFVRFFSPSDAGVPNDGSVTPVKLSTGGPSWDGSGNLDIGGEASVGTQLSIGSGTGTKTIHAFSGASDGPIVRLENTISTIATSNNYGKLEFYGNDSSSLGLTNGVRAQIVGKAADTVGSAYLNFATAGAYEASTTTRLSVTNGGVLVTGSVYSSGDVLQGATFVRVAGGVVLVNTDTQIDIDLTQYFTASTTACALLTVSVVATYTADATTPVYANNARYIKEWDQLISYNGTTSTYVLNNGGLIGAVYNSDATNFPAGAINASKALVVVSATQVLLRLQNRTTPAANSFTKYAYKIDISRLT